MDIVSKLYDTALCMKEAAEMMRLSHPETPHPDELERASRMVHSWAHAIEEEQDAIPKA